MLQSDIPKVKSTGHSWTTLYDKTANYVLSIFVPQKLDNLKVKKDVPISSQGRPWITVSDENVCDSPRNLYILAYLLLRTWFSPPAPLSSAAASLLVHWSLLSQGWASLLPQQPLSSHLEPPDIMVHFHCCLLKSYSEHWNQSCSHYHYDHYYSTFLC